MMPGEIYDKQSQVLPDDFLQFLSKNYKTISDIERKVEQFQNDSWGDFYKKLGCRNWRNMRLRSTKCDSVDSCFSDKDIKKVIRAKLKPKIKKMESNEQTDISDNNLQELIKAGKNDGPVDYSYLVQKFPLTYFAPDLCIAGRDEAIETQYLPTVVSQFKTSSHLPLSTSFVKFMVEGSKYPLSERVRVSPPTTYDPRQKESNPRVFSPILRVDNFHYQPSEYSSDDESWSNKKIKNSDNFIKEKSPSRQLLTLTLPPLHQSVLTLLGQKSGIKSSPRNHVVHELGSAFESTNNQKAKKLRRHGRKKKSKDEGKESEEKEIEKPETVADGRRDIDELQETQINALQNDGDLKDDDDAGSNFVQSPMCIDELKSLRDVLDAHLLKEQWSQKEMERLNEEIEKLSNGLKKYQTEFKAKSISMNEESWLAFPRTCTHTTATFGVPTSSKILQEITPVDYLKNYVIITEPRLHLYNLVYQRYRILENPTGKCITVKSLQRAITEVLGRPFCDEEMKELRFSYLQLHENHELDSTTFAGICAFCERIYGKYELEKRNECIICSKCKVADKERCHVKRKSALEDMDLTYLSNKIRFGETNESIAKLVQALTQSDSQRPT